MVFPLPDSLGKRRQRHRRDRKEHWLLPGAELRARLSANAPSRSHSSRTGSATSRKYPRRFLSPELLLSSGHYSSPTPSQGAPSDYASHAQGRTSSLPGVLRTPPGRRSPTGAPLPACPPETPRALLSGGRGLPSRRNRAGPVLRSAVSFWGKTYLLKRFSCDQRQCAQFLRFSP